MPIIRFDVLIDATHAALLPQRFEQLSALLIRDGVISGADVTWNDEPDVDPHVAKQLVDTFIADREESPLNAEELVKAYRVNRFEIKADGVKGSVNELTMTYSRLLTPPADLPRDHVALENEEAFEVVAPYPWTVEIFR